jgi:hypothetical protein
MIPVLNYQAMKTSKAVQVFLTSTVDGRVFSFSSRPPYPPGKSPDSHCVGGWVNPKPGLGAMEAEDRTPNLRPSSPWPVTVPTELWCSVLKYGVIIHLPKICSSVRVMFSAERSACRVCEKHVSVLVWWQLVYVKMYVAWGLRCLQFWYEYRYERRGEEGRTHRWGLGTTR